MNLTEQEHDNIRLHVGIHTGYAQIEKDPDQGLVGSKRFGGPLRPLPEFDSEIKAAAAALGYFSSHLLHDLNRMTMLLDVWEDQLHSVPRRELQHLIDAMALWIREHGGAA